MLYKDRLQKFKVLNWDLFFRYWKFAHSSCNQLAFFCESFDLDNRNAARCNRGDKMFLKENGKTEM